MTTLQFEAEFVLGIMLLAGVAVLSNTLKPWVARKAIHMGIGTLLVYSDLQDWRIRASVYLVTLLVTLLLVGVGRRLLYFLHNRSVDPGVVTYLFICSFCCARRIDFVNICPLFLADPMGAIVGRLVKTPLLYGKKSVGGSLAVVITAMLTINEHALPLRLFYGVAIGAIELFGGDYDNPLIGAFLLARALW